MLWILLPFRNGGKWGKSFKHDKNHSKYDRERVKEGTGEKGGASSFSSSIQVLTGQKHTPP